MEILIYCYIVLFHKERGVTYKMHKEQKTEA